MNEVERARRRMQLNDAFVPTQPISTRALFAGRLAEIDTIVHAIFEHGRHIILYGERGVGKTSFANIIHELLKSEGEEHFFVVVKATASSDDTFSTIWHDLASQLITIAEVRAIGFDQRTDKLRLSLDEMLPQGKDLLPSDVVGMVSRIEGGNISVFIIDEFDRVDDPHTRRLFADTIKAFSDNLPTPTLVIVGVARDVSELIGEHASIERSIAQVKLPLMTVEELREIIEKGLAVAEMSMDEEVKGRIATFSQGFPHYTHLLAKNACIEASEDGRLAVDLDDLLRAVERALSETSASIQDTYRKAVVSRKVSLFPDVLLACALAPMDEDRSFRAIDITKPLESITGRYCPPQTFTYHLGKLCDPERGAVLEKIGSRGRTRYKFRNPMMRPYLILRTYSLERISVAQLEEYLV
jgi:Cdc6-like AAA superfamily ATPase